ncbi:MAG: hypothetical protein JJLCMIEE_01993 [Acidimicrobiales bacterium]|nr:hypothetical protein [Acidimicrobiales bacterium]
MDADNKREFTEGLYRSHGSFELVLSPVILALLGLWLDRTIGTVPVFTAVFAAVGFLGAFIKLVYTYKAKMAELSREARWAAR